MTFLALLLNFVKPAALKVFGFIKPFLGQLILGGIAVGFAMWLLNTVHDNDRLKTENAAQKQVIASQLKWQAALDDEAEDAILREADTQKWEKQIDQAPQTGCGAVDPVLVRVLDGLR
jgi:hypothetical protein